MDVVSGDALEPDPAVIAEAVVNEARPGSIIVMYIGGAPRAPATALALRSIFSALGRGISAWSPSGSCSRREPLDLSRDRAVAIVGPSFGGGMWPMSQSELVDKFVSGSLSRRAFIRGLVKTGVSIGAAITYANVLATQANADAIPHLGKVGKNLPPKAQGKRGIANAIQKQSVNGPGAKSAFTNLYR